MKTPLFAAIAAISFSTIAAAQCTGLDPRLGSPLGLGTDAFSGPQALGFPFIMPSGSVSTHIQVDSEARIWPSGAYSGAISDWSPTNAEFVTLEQLAVFWNELQPGANGDAYFFSDPLAGPGGEVVITWLDIQTFGSQPGEGEFTVQLIMRGDGSFTMIYDGRVPLSSNFYDVIIGVSDGIDAATAPEVNLSDSLPAASGVITSPTGDGMMYENFGTNGFDLRDIRLDFAPNGSGGYICFGSVCQFAVADATGDACNFGILEGPPSAFGWDPDGLGGYIVASSAATYDEINLGTLLSAGDESINGVSLGFGFTMPGGSAVSFLDVSDNGNIATAGGLPFADFTPSLVEFLQRGPQIAPFWSDWEFAAANAGIYFYTDGVSRANITWVDAQQWGVGGTEITFQVQLDGSDGSWDIVYQSVGDFVGSAGGNDLLIGCTDGNRGAIPAESDLTGGLINTNGSPTMFEFFIEPFETQDLQSPAVVQEVTLTPTGLPQIGTVFTATFDGIPATAVGPSMLIGTSNPQFPMSNIWNLFEPNCRLLSLGDIAVVPVTYTPGASTAGWTLDLTAASPAAIGFPVILQGLVVDPAAFPWASQLALTLTNGIEGVIGN